MKVSLTEAPDEREIRELGMLATISAVFLYYDQLGKSEGPFLKPVDTGFTPLFSPDLIAARRYRGKTNEQFTHFLCNLARFSSGFSDLPWKEINLFDPLAGGGTTLFTGLVLGANVAGVEIVAGNAHSTATFLKQFTKEERIACSVKEERLKKSGGKIWRFTMGNDPPRKCIISRGDTVNSAGLVSGLGKPHLIVGDLPYGIKHKGKLEALLGEALPVWAFLLRDGGALTLAWDSTRFSRSDMLALVDSEGSFDVLDDPPYDSMAHRVDRVIKHRDVLVAVKREM